MSESKNQPASPTPADSSGAAEIEDAKINDRPPVPAPAGDSGGAVRPYINDQLNSRSNRALPQSDSWKIHWQQEIENGFMPAFVLQAADRILLQGPNGFKLLNLEDGKTILMDGLGPGNPVLDLERGLFFHPESSGMIAARHLTDGARVFITGSYAGNQFSQVFMAPRGRRLLVVSVEFKGDPHGAHLPDFTAVQVQDLGDPPRPDENLMLAEARTLAQFTRETSKTLTAVNKETVVIAAPRRIFVTDFSLHAPKEFKAEFEPVAMSLDELGRIYLVVRINDRNAFWVVSPEGKRLTSFMLPRDMQIVPTPPIIGYNYRCYITGSDRVLAIDPSGKLAWVQRLQSPRGTAVVTANDQLLVADGRELVAFDATGQRRLLHSFAGDFLTTSPVLTAKGEILVASERHLYLLSP